MSSHTTLAEGANRRPVAKVVSILATDIIFEGSISGDCELLIDGVVKGDINVARLVVGEHAHVEGTIRGGSVEIRGAVRGNIESKSVRLLESAQVEGDITHEQLSIEVGAFFQGRCQQMQAIAPPVLATAEPKSADIIELEQAAQR